MRRLRNFLPGTFVRIPLPDGSFGYGCFLGAPYAAFYHHHTSEPSSALDVIASRPILFRQAVRVRESDGWADIGRRPLQGEVAEPVLRFMQDLADFHRCVLFDSAGMEKRVAPEACIGVERAAVWDAHHIEARLLDTFLGRPNAAELHARVRLR